MSWSPFAGQLCGVSGPQRNVPGTVFVRSSYILAMVRGALRGPPALLKFSAIVRNVLRAIAPEFSTKILMLYQLIYYPSVIETFESIGGGRFDSAEDLSASSDCFDIDEGIWVPIEDG